MGTRHLIVVVKNGEFKVAQYGQWDGYPSGQGVDLFKFCSDQQSMTNLRTNIDRCYWITNEEIENLYEQMNIKINDGFTSWDDAKRFSAAHPELSRDTGSNILNIIADLAFGKKLGLRNSVKFAEDSLFCEYGYVIDLDTNRFEVYKGFNNESLDESDRFYNPDISKDEEYQPIKLFRFFELNDLPDVKCFLTVCEDSNEEEEAA